MLPARGRVPIEQIGTRPTFCVGACPPSFAGQAYSENRHPPSFRKGMIFRDMRYLLPAKLRLSRIT